MPAKPNWKKAVTLDIMENKTWISQCNPNINANKTTLYLDLY